MADERLYAMSLRAGMWLAYSLDGKLLAKNKSAEGLVEERSQKGWRLFSISEDALDELNWYLENVRPVFDYIEDLFPNHVYVEEETAPVEREPIGFRLDSSARSSPKKEEPDSQGE